ncbi:RIP metalloprotease RseP [Candidatus Peregrinibacteria bacterium]|nr:RIP metalloprotease RseP [Candidatus Peregrinibacteria bacterium]
MYLLLTIIAFVIIFSIIVLIHELGHFWAAKRNGVKVEEFGFGLPPKLWSVKRGETIYSINLLPFGGFVRLMGEDSKDPKMYADSRSFISKPLRTRTKIIVAGVLMNFLLAIVLLSIGFSVGIKPLIISDKDVFANISNNTIQISEGIIVKDITKGTPAANAGFMAGDILMQMDNKDITDLDVLKNTLIKLPASWPTFKVRRDNSIINIAFGGGTGLPSGINLYDMFFLPRATVKTISADSEAAKAGLKSGDAIIKINGKQVYDVDTFQEIMDFSQNVSLVVMRDFKAYEFNFNVPYKKSVIVSDTILGGVAEKAGFMKGDYILQINGKNVASPSQAVEMIKQSGRKTLQFLVERNGASVLLNAAPNSKGEIGIILSKIFSMGNSQFSAYTSSIPTSVLEIKNVSYPIHEAIWKSFTESKRLTVFTVQMFGKLVKDVFGTLTVPEGVSGPVGIAHMTYVFVKEGLSSVVRFAALLSLSLAVLNILPFPGLDGGRLLFIVVEGISGRRMNQRFETMTHFIGFILLLFLILFVTYKDVLSLL